MTRVLIIGSSHIGAYKSAATAFEEKYGGVTLDFYPLRGPQFLGGTIKQDGFFHPSYRSDQDRDFVRATAGQTEIEVTGFDHLLLVGHRFGVTTLPELLKDHDILGGIRTHRPRLMTEEMVKDSLAALVENYVGSANKAVSAYGRPVTFAMAPFPARSLTEGDAVSDFAQLIQSFWQRPDAGWVFDLWRDMVRRKLAAEGHHLLDQPEALTAGPFATPSEFTKRAVTMDGSPLGKTDHRHMNAYFGLGMLSAYAEDILGLPAPGPRKPAQLKTLKKRTA